jgi:hypothetical protein
LIAFLDSDDAWNPHHLALATALFDAHPDAHLYFCEMWEQFGHGAPVVHPRTEMGAWYPETAERIGSTAFPAPPPDGDPYRWYFEDSEPLPPWAREVLAATPYAGARLYRGDLFQKWRWGWLMSIITVVISRHALEAVGPMDESYPVANDFTWLATLCRRFPANFVSAPGAVKYEYADDAQRHLDQAHLVTGSTATQFHLDVLRAHESLFWSDAPSDPELSALRGFRQSLVARAALRSGQRALARSHLEQAVRTYPGPDTSALLWLARLPQDALAGMVYRGSMAGARLASKVRRAVEARAP